MITPRNVLFIVADQWRGDTLGCAGHPCVRTPHLDALASEGTLFRRHFSQAAPCGPGRASLYTGLYLFKHRVVDNGTPLDSRFTNFALEARRGGHDPTLFGYTSTSVDPRNVPDDDPGLLDYEGVLPGLSHGVAGKWEPWLRWLGSRGFNGPLTPEMPAMRRSPSTGPARFTDAALYDSEESETAFLCGELLGWLGQRRGKGWFAHLSIKKPHPPWVAPSPYNRMYDPAWVPAPTRASSADAEAHQHPFLAWLLKNHRRTHYTLAGDLLEASLDEAEIAALRAAYYGLITEVDTHVGRILAYLREAGELDHTLVVFTSDHGEHLGDHHLLGKSGYFDGGFHVPLILRDPRASAEARGRAVDFFTEAVDVMPTLLDWLELPIPPDCDGNSLLPLVRSGQAPGWRSEAHWEFDFRDIRKRRVGSDLGLAPDECSLAVIRGDRYKYVHFAGMQPLLFDLQADPSELTNVAQDRAYLDQRVAMAEAMITWRATHGERTLANSQVGAGGLYSWSGPRRRDQAPGETG